MNKSKYFILPIFLYLLSGTARAVDINIAITGAIYVPPCVVNNNIPIQFSFNQIMTYKVDGQTSAITKIFLLHVLILRAHLTSKYLAFS